MDFWAAFSETARVYGIFAALFIASQVYFIWESRNRESRYIEREERYISVIENLSDNFNDIKNDVQQIKNKLWS